MARSTRVPWGTWPEVARPFAAVPRVGGRRLVIPGLLVAGLLLLGCGGRAATGPPRFLSLSGDRIPASDVTTAVTQMCDVAARSAADPVGAAQAYYAGPGPGIARLATVLDADHATESRMLLDALAGYERDIAAKPPAPATATAAANLLQAAKQDLRLLRLTPPSC